MLKSPMPHVLTGRGINIRISKFTKYVHMTRNKPRVNLHMSKYILLHLVSPGANSAHKQIYLGVPVFAFTYVSKLCL